MKNYLDPNQIKKLESLGITLENGGDIVELLELLPKKIDGACAYDDDDCEDKYLLKIYPASNRVSYEVVSDPLCGDYDPFELKVFKSDELVDSLFGALTWCIEKKYLNVN